MAKHEIQGSTKTTELFVVTDKRCDYINFVIDVIFIDKQSASKWISDFANDTTTPIFRMAKGAVAIAELLKKLDKQKSNVNTGKKNG